MPEVVKFYPSIRKFTFALFFSCPDPSHSSPVKREMMNNKFEEFEQNDLILRGRAGKFNRWDEESKQGEIPDKVFLCPRPNNIKLPKDKKVSSSS